MLVALVVLAELPPQRDVPYIVFPVLLWAALRFGPRGAATAILVVCSITVWNTAQNDGPFVRDSITDSLLATQLFIATAALTSLVLAAVTAERTRAARALAATEAAQRALADEQAALRRVATLVAGEASPSRVFEQVTEEVGAAARAARRERDAATTARGTATVVGAWSEDGAPRFPVGAHARPRRRHGRRRRCSARGRPQRVERYEEAGGTLAATLRGVGYRAGVAAPVSVGGRLWGVLAAATTSDEPLPRGSRAAAVRLRRPGRAGAGQRRRLREAGRVARARRRGRRRRAPAARAQPARRRPAAARLGRARAEHGRREARERPGSRARGAVRGTGRSRPRARRSCASWRAASTRPSSPSAGSARRSTRCSRARPSRSRSPSCPSERLAAPVEAAAYYVVAEAITNVAQVRARVARDRRRRAARNGCATVTVCDDGVGGADPAGGSGLRGLAARVEALNGRLDVDSPPHGGTAHHGRDSARPERADQAVSVTAASGVTTRKLKLSSR